MKVDLFNTAFAKVDGGAMFGVVPKTLWSRYIAADENNNIDMAHRSLVVNTGDRVILVDTGWGDKQNENFFKHLYMHGGEGLVGGLAARGYKPEDITDVFLTHLHADHCGGCLKNDRKKMGFVHLFPNAKYHVSRVQWEWALKGNLREANSFLKENFLPLADDGRLNLLEDDCELFPGFETKICYGHTPGFTYVVVKCDGKQFAFVSDLIPTAAHVRLIWNTSYEIDVLKHIEEKKACLIDAVKENRFLVFQHDASVECASLKTTPKGVIIDKTCRFDELMK
ncbi:MAG: MBL fold metallo-hydrolase [Bacteroidales bacterium]|nr:MBL fold metallo-hydrolase [Bacteroidales bacterium]